MEKGTGGGQFVALLLTFLPIFQCKSLLLEESGKGISSKGKSVDVGMVHKNGEGGRAETEGPCY